MSAQSEVRPTLSGSTSVSPESGRPSSEAGLPTPAEIARIAEGYDDEDWFEFLDQMDEVYRRRRQREEEPDPPVDADRETLAEWSAKKYLIVDRTIREVLYLPEGAPIDEIRLIFIIDRLVGPEPSHGPLSTISFPLGIEGSPFRVNVADVNRDQFEAIRTGELLMPAGWMLENHKSYKRRYP